MAPAAFLALLAIGMLILCFIRLELTFRRGEQEPAALEPRAPRPELRAAPAGGYCQAPLSAGPFGKG